MLTATLNDTIEIGNIECDAAYEVTYDLYGSCAQIHRIELISWNINDLKLDRYQAVEAEGEAWIKSCEESTSLAGIFSERIEEQHKYAA